MYHDELRDKMLKRLDTAVASGVISTSDVVLCIMRVREGASDNTPLGVDELALVVNKLLPVEV